MTCRQVDAPPGNEWLNASDRPRSLWAHEVEDDTTKETYKVRTKADSVIYFDDLQITVL